MNIEYKNKTGIVMPRRKLQTQKQVETENNKIEDQIETMQAYPWKPIRPLFCTPNCQHKHHHQFQDDYSKSNKDPRPERPGVPFLFEGLKNAPKNANTNNPNDLHKGKGLGAYQTPINLKTGAVIHPYFQDTAFKFNYEKVNPNETMKFNEQGDAFYYTLNANKDDAEKESYFETNTISLFDPHIEKAKLFGMQYHFHSPSEHSVDGELLDLEMHIVHGLQSESSGQASLTQFSNGVLGFLFKVMPDSYFEHMSKHNPQVNLDFHDNFLADLADSEADSAKQQQRDNLTYEKGKSLDLTKFVQLLEFNRRWTYQGSLTTIPCSEGILWNVIEQVIPIRQTTLDKFNYFRKIEENQYANKGNSSDPWLNEAKEKEYPINGNSVVRDGDKFMRIAVCNRKVVDVNGRPVYHVDLADPDKPLQEIPQENKVMYSNQNQAQVEYQSDQQCEPVYYDAPTYPGGPQYYEAAEPQYEYIPQQPQVPPGYMLVPDPQYGYYAEGQEAPTPSFKQLKFAAAKKSTIKYSDEMPNTEATPRPEVTRVSKQNWKNSKGFSSSFTYSDQNATKLIEAPFPVALKVAYLQQTAAKLQKSQNSKKILHPAGYKSINEIEALIKELRTQGRFTGRDSYSNKYVSKRNTFPVDEHITESKVPVNEEHRPQRPYSPVVPKMKKYKLALQRQKSKQSVERPAWNRSVSHKSMISGGSPSKSFVLSKNNRLMQLQRFSHAQPFQSYDFGSHRQPMQ